MKRLGLLIASIIFAYSTNAIAFGSGGCDQFTKFLTHFDGTSTVAASENCGNANAHAMTANGNATQINSDKFAKAATFDGTGDYYSVADGATDADWDYGTGDFTIDFWVKFNTVGSARIIDVGNGIGATGVLIRYSNANARWEIYFNTAEPFAGNLGHTPTAGTWYHIELARKGSDLRFFINGTQLYITVTDTTNLSCAAEVRLGIGASGTEGLNGLLDEVRFSKGIARHIQNSTVPTTPYCAGCEFYQVI